MVEHEIRADEVHPGDYLAGLGRVQSFNDSGGAPGKRRVTLYSEGQDWRVNVHPSHRVVVLRKAAFDEDDR
jgi:hypothetical protein